MRHRASWSSMNLRSRSSRGQGPFVQNWPVSTGMENDEMLNDLTLKKCTRNGFHSIYD